MVRGRRYNRNKLWHFKSKLDIRKNFFAETSHPGLCCFLPHQAWCLDHHRVCQMLPHWVKQTSESPLSQHMHPRSPVWNQLWSSNCQNKKGGARQAVMWVNVLRENETWRNFQAPAIIPLPPAECWVLNPQIPHEPSLVAVLKTPRTEVWWKDDSSGGNSPLKYSSASSSVASFRGQETRLLWKGRERTWAGFFIFGMKRQKGNLNPMMLQATTTTVMSH